MDHYDILIHIDTAALNRCHQSVTANDAVLTPFAGRKFANIPNESDDSAVAWPGFDPVALFGEDLKVSTKLDASIAITREY
jgi:hypothetical protein